MKKLIMSLLCISFGGIFLLFAPCKNNPGGGGKNVHVKAIGKKKKKDYICPYKSRGWYESKGMKKINFYKKDICKRCGCPSSEHEPFVPSATTTTSPQKNKTLEGLS